MADGGAAGAAGVGGAVGVDAVPVETLCRACLVGLWDVMAAARVGSPLAKALVALEGRVAVVAREALARRLTEVLHSPDHAAIVDSFGPVEGARLVVPLVVAGAVGDLVRAAT